MTNHRESSTFTVRLELSAEFAEEYDGDEDGYAWLEAFRDAVRPALARAVFESIRKDARFDAVPAPRGASPDDELNVAVRFRPAKCTL